MPDVAAENRPKDETRQSPLKRFLYRKRIVIPLAAFGLYVLFGFFAVPPLVEKYGIEAIEEATGRTADVGEIKFNPLTLSIDLQGFELKDTDGTPLASFAGLHVNFQSTSLFRWAWTFHEIRIEKAYLLHEQFSPEDSRFGRLASDIERLNPSTEDGDDVSAPRLVLGHLAVADGRALFRDHTPEEPVELSTGPININVRDLSTLPDRTGSNAIEIRLPDGARLSWQGEFGLEPLHSTGALSLENWNPEPVLPYLQESLPITGLQARLNVSGQYAIDQAEDSTLRLRVTGVRSRLVDVLLEGLDPETGFLAFDALEIEGGELAWPEERVTVERVRLLNPAAHIWLDEEGQLSLMQLVPEEGYVRDEAAESSWDIAAGSVELAGGQITASDRSIDPGAEFGLENLSVTLSKIDNRDGTTVPASLSFDVAGGGRIAFDGSVVVIPGVVAKGEATVEQLPVSLAEPYVQQQYALDIDDGLLDVSLQLEFHQDSGLSSTGQLTVSNAHARDTDANQTLFTAESLLVDRFEIDQAAMRAAVSSLRLVRPYGRVHIRADRSTNIGSVLGIEADSTEAVSDGPPWSVLLGGVAIDDGSMDFSDYSLPLLFSTKITGLDGTVSTIDSTSSEPADINMEGQVDEYGLARFDGSMNPFDPFADSRFTVEFSNLLVNSLSPYSAEFAGREIAAGKLDLDLEYVVKAGMLDGKNAMVLRDLELGGEVESENAVSLPLDLAIALLKDSDGVIDIDLPVEGDINDPEFRIGGVIWKAFTGLITKIVAAPFKLLGSLIGIESDEFGQFRFLPARADLTPPEREMVQQLMEVLVKRPELDIEISGVYDAATDTAALKRAQLRRTVFEKIGRDPAVTGDPNEMLDEEVRGVLERLFSERFPETPLDTVKTAHSAPPAGDPEGVPVLDATAYSGELIQRLADSEPIGTAELEALAGQRAQAVMDAFIEAGLAPERASLGTVSVVESEDEWIVMELGVAAR